MPLAIFARVFALAGATTNRSAQIPRSTWLDHSPLSLSKRSTITGLPESVARVRGVMNSVATGVIITLTLAPSLTINLTRKAALYAAILPVMPSNIFFPLSIPAL